MLLRGNAIPGRPGSVDQIQVGEKETVSLGLQNSKGSESDENQVIFHLWSVFSLFGL